jgi:hypothetical protein
MSFPETRTARQFGKQCAGLGFDWEQSWGLYQRSDVARDDHEFIRGYNGSALHFVGFRGNEYRSAVRVFGKPDFIHRHWDARAKHGGELAPDDMIVFAKGTEHDPVVPFTFDDSAVM